mgnify:CR=1 FL=1
MKPTTKTFDCVNFMDQEALRIHEETKGMSVEEELAFWKRRHAEAEKELDARPSEGPGS